MNLKLAAEATKVKSVIVEIDGKEHKITKNAFIGAFMQHQDEGGYSYDPWDCAMNWGGFVLNERRGPDDRNHANELEQEIWVPLLKPYLDLD